MSSVVCVWKRLQVRAGIVLLTKIEAMGESARGGDAEGEGRKERRERSGKPKVHRDPLPWKPVVIGGCALHMKLDGAPTHLHCPVARSLAGWLVGW